MRRLALLSLALLLLSVSRAAADPDKDRPPSFKEKVEAAGGVIIYPLVTYSVVPGLECLPLLEQEVPELKDFATELLKELTAKDTKRRRLAVEYLATLALAVRTAAWTRDRDDSDDVFPVALGRHAKPLQTALSGLLKEVRGEEAVLAATALLALTPDHQGATTILCAELKSKDPKQRAKACEAIGMARLSHPDLIASLSTALADREGDVRRTAARAASEIGPKAAKTVPGLIELLKAGEVAYGEIQPFGVIALPRRANVALLALAEIGTEAQKAVSTLAELLDKAETEKRLNLLACLSQVGPGDKRAVVAIRRQMGAEESTVRLHAAAALLCIDPKDKKASEALIAALVGKEKERKVEALEACARMAPKVKAFVAPLTLALKEDEPSRLRAAAALGWMGTVAEPAIPALAKMMTDKQFDFHTHRAAASALARIGKASLPTLVRVLMERDVRGAGAAAYALGRLGKDAAPALPELIKALSDEYSDVRCCAATALGRLRGEAARARGALTRARQSDEVFEVRMLAAWALTQLER
jgi:HEAT repeat protein